MNISWRFKLPLLLSFLLIVIVSVASLSVDRSVTYASGAGSSTSRNISGRSARASFLAQTTNWHEEGFNLQHTSFNPDEHILTPANVSGLITDWSIPTSTDFSPVFVNGVL